MLKIRTQWQKGQSKPLMKKWPLVSLTGTTKVVGLVVKQCIAYLVMPILMLIGCNQETIAQGEGSASSTASTSNRPDSIIALNEASVGIVRATLPYCSQRDSASCLARLVPLVTSGRLILDC